MRFQPLALLSCLLLIPGLLPAAEKTIYGLNEYVSLPELKLEVAAKLDTGAETASLSARDITRFRRNGETWVRFYLAIDDSHEHPIERPLARVSKIKRRSGDYDPAE
ncbi:RimK/LysX family protein, partial [Azotobacter chroococcum]|nr:RimK/LysX family protein [Azotobacter chroococcum]